MRLPGRIATRAWIALASQTRKNSAASINSRDVNSRDGSVIGSSRLATIIASVAMTKPVVVPAVTAAASRTPFSPWRAWRLSSQYSCPVAISTHPASPARKYSQRSGQLSNAMKCMPVRKRCVVAAGCNGTWCSNAPVAPSK